MGWWAQCLHSSGRERGRVALPPPTYYLSPLKEHHHPLQPREEEERGGPFPWGLARKEVKSAPFNKPSGQLADESWSLLGSAQGQGVKRQWEDCRPQSKGLLCPRVRTFCNLLHCRVTTSPPQSRSLETSCFW